MAFRLGIELGNAAMSTPEHVADALEKAAARIRDCGGWVGAAEAGNIRDENGNTVGSWDVEDAPEPPYCDECGLDPEHDGHMPSCSHY